MSPLLVAYFGVVTLLSVFGFHRLILVVTYLRRRDQALPIPPPLADESCPIVLVQLPVYNEAGVVERLLHHVTNLDWPRDRLRIQLLDDSDDETTDRARSFIDGLHPDRPRVVLIRRRERVDFKAGALREGLRLDEDNPEGAAPLVLILDADFTPRPDLLRRLAPTLVDDPSIGMVQARWSHLNHHQSLLTRLQAMLLDGHFVVEHGARFRGGHFFNFNGTAGIWRRDVISQAGSWSGDTITEDLDLSYRAQLAGARFAYAQCLDVPAELPLTAAAFKSQQHRWAKGSIQTLLKLGPRILRSELPLATRVEALFHLGGNLAFPLMVLLVLLLPMTLPMRQPGQLLLNLGLDIPVFLFATLSLLLFYGLSAQQSRPASWRRDLPYVPLVLGLGAALTLNNTRAVFEALLGHHSPFVRTPKSGDSGLPPPRRKLAGTQALGEVALAIYFGLAVAYALHRGLWFPLPFLALFAFSFALLGLGLGDATPTKNPSEPFTPQEKSRKSVAQTG